MHAGQWPHCGHSLSDEHKYLNETKRYGLLHGLTSSSYREFWTLAKIFVGLLAKKAFLYMRVSSLGICLVFSSNLGDLKKLKIILKEKKKT